MFFFFNDTATTEIYTLSLHDALPILKGITANERRCNFYAQSTDSLATALNPYIGYAKADSALGDRKSTRLNSSHLVISYAVFCLKKKKKKLNSHAGRCVTQEIRLSLY